MMSMYRIIVVDDEVWVVIGIKKLIQKTGLPFEIIAEANNGIAAYEKVMTLKPDILISDIRMPGLNGLDLMKKLNESDINLKVIFISGFAEFKYAQAAVALGALDYLLKPIEEDAIRAILERFIAIREGRSSKSGAEPDKIQIEDPRIKRVVEEINQCYKEEISLGFLAEKYNLSIGYLSSLIKKELGQSFSEYISMKRMQDAKQLLMREDLSIDAVAEMVGYKDYFYFTKVFKNYTGVSPSKFRKKQED
jgi:Response regulator containing CheY-like receiver domain and AraC-type DNA-binding domain